MLRFMQYIAGTICIAWLAAVPLLAVGQDDADAELETAEDAQVEAAPEAGDAMVEQRNGAIYIPLQPPFVVNYGGPGRLKYIKADVAVRLQDAQTANSVRHHMPYIRNNLVMLFSAQTEESISSQEGKEALRKEALQEVRELIQAEDQQDGVVDLYFNAFVLQK